MQAKHGQAQADLRIMKSSEPLKAQKTTEFIFLALKIGKQDGIKFLTTAQDSSSASVTHDAVFRQVATAGGLSYTKKNLKLCFQM